MLGVLLPWQAFITGDNSNQDPSCAQPPINSLYHVCIALFSRSVFGPDDHVLPHDSSVVLAERLVSTAEEVRPCVCFRYRGHPFPLSRCCMHPVRCGASHPAAPALRRVLAA